MHTEHCTAARFFACLDALKRRCRPRFSNVFLDGPTLEGVLTRKDCRMAEAGDSLFLLVPRHGVFHDLYFYAPDAGQLEAGLTALRACHDGTPLHAVVVGKEGQVGHMTDVFSRQGFALQKKLCRTISPGFNSAVKALCASLEPNYKEHVAFAEAGDEEEILRILLETFDIYSEDIPELDEIRDAIRLRRILVLRLDGEIAALHYFTLENHVYRGFFDVTIPRYRKEFLFFNIITWLDDYIHDKGIAVNKSYGWRDAKKKRLQRFAGILNQRLDGVEMYNFLRGGA